MPSNAIRVQRLQPSHITSTLAKKCFLVPITADHLSSDRNSWPREILQTVRSVHECGFLPQLVVGRRASNEHKYIDEGMLQRILPELGDLRQEIFEGTPLDPLLLAVGPLNRADLFMSQYSGAGKTSQYQLARDYFDLIIGGNDSENNATIPDMSWVKSDYIRNYPTSGGPVMAPVRWQADELLKERRSERWIMHFRLWPASVSDVTRELGKIKDAPESRTIPEGSPVLVSNVKLEDAAYLVRAIGDLGYKPVLSIRGALALVEYAMNSSGQVLEDEGTRYVRMVDRMIAGNPTYIRKSLALMSALFLAQNNDLSYGAANKTMARGFRLVSGL